MIHAKPILYFNKSQIEFKWKSLVHDLVSFEKLFSIVFLFFFYFELSKTVCETLYTRI